MIPELFSIGPLSISPFGVMLVAAFLTAYFQLRRGLKYRGIGDEEDASAILFAAGVGGIVGAKVYYAILYQDWRLLYDRSGLVWYGGFFLATLAVWWTMRRRKLPMWPTLDAAGVGLALGYAVGRVGCFLVGDDYGVPTDLPWGVRFTNGVPPSTAYELRNFGVEVPPEVPGNTVMAVHPTPLYETLLALIIWQIGWRHFRKSKKPGTTFCLVLILLALERFAVEFLRAKDDRFFGPLTLAQVLSLLIVVVVGIVASRRRAEA